MFSHTDERLHIHCVTGMSCYRHLEVFMFLIWHHVTLSVNKSIDWVIKCKPAVVWQREHGGWEHQQSSDSKQGRAMPGMPERQKEHGLYDKQIRGGWREHTSDPLSTRHFSVYADELFFLSLWRVPGTGSRWQFPSVLAHLCYFHTNLFLNDETHSEAGYWEIKSACFFFCSCAIFICTNTLHTKKIFHTE